MKTKKYVYLAIMQQIPHIAWNVTSSRHGAKCNFTAGLRSTGHFFLRLGTILSRVASDFFLVFLRFFLISLFFF